MKKIVVENIRIIDFSEEKSCFVEFKNGINIVTSRNTSRGKSSILRAVYHSMGADSGYDKSFKIANKVFDITFNYNNQKYRIIRKGNKYFCFINSKMSMICTGYKQLANFFEQEFGLSVYLTDRKGQLDIAPTTYLFIPYFADQDLTWKILQSVPFKNSQQFEDSSLINLYYYHMGILNKTYYTYNNKKLNYLSEIKQFKQDNEDLQKRIFSLKEYFNSSQISIDESSAKSNLDFLKSEINKYLKAENKTKNILFENENNIAKFTIQIEKIEELLKDIKKLDKTHIECPNCGFEIKSDENVYEKELLKQKLEIIKLDLNNEQIKYDKNKDEYSKVVKQIENLTKKYTNDNATFENFLKTQTSKILLGDLENEYLKTFEELSDLNNKINEVEDILNLYNEKKIQVNKEFKTTYLKNLNDLGINNVANKELRCFKIYRKSGSQLVRSMLAYFITIIQLKNQYNRDNYNFPLIIDSPLEGEQDDIDKNEIINKILEIYNKSDMQNQIIIASLNAYELFPNDKDINFIELNTEKEHLLTNECYKKDAEIVFIKNLIDENIKI